jgi:hypothetical protein
MTTYNAMMEGFVKQLDTQVFKKLFKMNELVFPAMENRPKLTFTPIEKGISLDELGTFMSNMDWMILGDDDIKAIREKSGFLPNAIPEQESTGVKAPMVKKESSFALYMDKLKESDPDKYQMIIERTADGLRNS